MLLSISYGSISQKPDGGLYTFSLSYKCVFPCPVFSLDLFGTKMKPNQFSVDINPHLKKPTANNYNVSSISVLTCICGYHTASSMLI